jgi:hypothetical protein
MVEFLVMLGRRLFPRRQTTLEQRRLARQIYLLLTGHAQLGTPQYTLPLSGVCVDINVFACKCVVNVQSSHFIIISF